MKRIGTSLCRLERVIASWSTLDQVESDWKQSEHVEVTGKELQRFYMNWSKIKSDKMNSTVCALTICQLEQFNSKSRLNPGTTKSDFYVKFGALNSSILG